MIVPFVLLPSSLNTAHASEGHWLLDHERFLEAWELHGLLVESNNTAAATRNAIENLPQRLRKLWQTAYPRFRRLSVDWPALNESAPLDALRHPPRRISLACVSQEVALRLGLPPNEPLGHLHELGLEVSLLAAADRTQAFTRARAMAHQPIDAATPSDRIWQDRFVDLIETSRHCTIIDRYAGRSMLERRDERDGLRSFVRRTTQTRSRLKTLSIITTFAPGVAVTQSLLHPLFSIVDQRYEIEVRALSDPDFARLSHGRYIRFDHTVLELDTGLDVLSSDTVYRRCLFSFRLARESDREIERSLTASATCVRPTHPRHSLS